MRRAEEVQAIFDSEDFGDTVMHQTDALGKAYAVSEIIWDRSERQWWMTFAERDPRFFTYDRATGRELRLLDESNASDGIPLPPYKFMVHTPKIRSGLPIRGGLARLAAVGCMCKAWSWRDWMAFADIYGLPMRVGRYGPTATQGDIDKLLAAVANLGSDAAAVMPESTRVEFTQAANTAGAAEFFSRLTEWWDKQISKGVLGQTMTTDDGASMSQAMVHNEVRKDILTADARALTLTVRGQVVRPYIDLNYGDGRYPIATAVVPQPDNTEQLVNAIATLAPFGFRVEQSVIRDRLGVPEPAAGAEIFVSQAAPASPFATPPVLNQARNNEDPVPAPTVTGHGDAVDLATDLLDRETAPIITGWVAELADLADDAGSFEAFKAQLLDRYASLSIAPLARVLAQAMAVAQLAGRGQVQDWLAASMRGDSPDTALNSEQAGAGIINRGWAPAADFFMQKVNLPTTSWRDLWQGQHARAFVVAGATKEALLADLRTAVENPVVFGGSYDTFRREFEQVVARHGWTGWTGESSEAGRAWRARTIWQTNMATAHAAGRYQQMTDPAVLAHMPYWQYRHNSVTNPRADHQAWDGLVLMATDPWWSTHYPPNGWNCRCDVRPLSERQLQRLDKSGPDQAPPPGPGDPPPEWSYNVGEAAWGKPVAESVLQAERGGRMVSLDDRGPADFGRPAEIPADQTAAQPLDRIRDPAEVRQAFREAVGGESAIFVDPAGGRINVTDAVIEHWLDDPKRMQGREQYLPMLRELIEQPFEVWAGFAVNELTGKIELRRRYVKMVDVGRNRVIGFVADAVAGQWVGFNMFSGGASGARNLRVGRLLWGRGA